MATARLRPQMMRLTDAAADRIKSVMANAGRPIVGVRVGVKKGGCAGMSYTMEYAEKVEPSDEVVEDEGVRVLIDPKAVLFLLAKVDKGGFASARLFPQLCVVIIADAVGPPSSLLRHRFKCAPNGLLLRRRPVYLFK